MSVAKRMALLLGSSLFALLIIGGAGLWQTAQVESALRYVNSNTLPSVIAIEDTSRVFWQVRTALWQHVASTDLEKKKGYEARYNELLADVMKRLDDYGQKHISDSGDLVSLKADQAAMQGYTDYFGRAIELSRDNKGEEVFEFTAKGKDVAQRAIDAFDAHIAYNKQHAENRAKAAAELAALGRILTVGLIVLMIVATAIAGILLLRSVVVPLSNARNIMADVERNLDFTQRAKVERQDEIGEMVAAINSLLSRMQSNLREISQGVGGVADSALALVTNSQQVSESSGRQSDVAAEMAASMEEMAVSINHVASRSQEAVALSRNAGQLAQEGVSTISHTLTDINNISQVSRTAAADIAQLENQTARISEVVTIIREVADQTNLLALNAAIEAARAGESGRGFAVVADEIRKLAERTATSTQQIASTIEQIRQTSQRSLAGMNETVLLVEDSVSRANEASQAISRIGEGASNTVAMVGDITNAIREQSAATDGVAGKVEVIAQMAEENSAAAANTAESARNLDALAERMRKVVAAYRL